MYDKPTLDDYCNKSLEVSSEKEEIKYFNDTMLHIINEVFGALGPETNMNFDTLNRCMLNSDSDYNKMLGEWSRKITHTYHKGTHKSSNIFVDGVRKFNLDSYILKQYNFTMHHNTPDSRMDFNKEKFYDVCCMEIAMMLCKYKQIFRFEIDAAILKVLFRYFKVYTQVYASSIYLNCIKRNDFYDVRKMLFGTTMLYYEKYRRLIPNTDFVSMPRGGYIKKDVPTVADDITPWIEDWMTREQKCMALMEHFPGIRTKRTAIEYLKKLGFTKTNKKKDNSVGEERLKILRRACMDKYEQFTEEQRDHSGVCVPDPQNIDEAFKCLKQLTATLDIEQVCGDFI